ncbi:MAG: putative outer membrane protein PmpB [Chlamydiae bacterium]|nr:putative outer membrane protein PmpB [Chlamydiota bacterium]
MQRILAICLFGMSLFATPATVTLNIDSLAFGTLRTVITTLNSGSSPPNNITFTITPTTITLTMSPGLPLPTWPGTWTIDGFNGGSTVTVDGSGVFQIFGGAITPVITFDLQNINFSNANVAVNGSVFHSLGPVLTSNTAFNTCIAGNDGGAIYGTNTITLNNTNSFTSCTATAGDGGAIYGTSTITLTTPGMHSFTNCQATAGDGGAIYGVGAIQISNGTFNICTAGTNGGAIWGQDAVDVADTNFDTCVAGTNGGAIWGQGTITHATGGTFRNCTAGTHGGAIYGSGASADILLDGTNTFTNCTATTGDGGAIRGGSTVFVGGATFGDAILGGCTAGTNGGAIRGIGAITLFDGGTFNTCTAGTDGGAIYGNNIINLNGISAYSFTNCQATAGNGGAIWGNNTITLNGTGTNSFSSCQSTNGNGGAIYGSNAISVSNGDFNTCAAVNDGGAILGLNTITLTSTSTNSFTDCTSTNGNGGAIWGNNTITLNGTGTNSFSGCQASDSGGAIFGNDVILLSNGGTFNICTAGSSGGAIWGANTITLNGTNGFSGCQASDSGGAIFGSTDAISVSDGTFSTCIAGINGGAILGFNTITLTGTNSFTGCTASLGFGGAIFGSDVISVSNGTFNTCQATIGNGGAIYGENIITLTNTNSFDTCSAQKGGAIFGSSTITIPGGSFANCSATQDGGAIYLASTGTLSMLGPVSFSGNTATRGNEIFMESGSSIIFDTTANIEIPSGIESEQGAMVGGGLIKRNTGKLTLNGANTYTGDTTIEKDELHLDGSLVTHVNVQQEGTLSGNIVIYNGDLINDGSILPGNGSIGEIRLKHGKFVQSSTGTLEVDITPTGNDSDKIYVEISLASSYDGTLLVDLDPGNYINGTLYTVIDGEVAFDVAQANANLVKTGPFADLVNIEVIKGSLQLIIQTTILFPCGNASPGNPQTMVEAIKHLNLPPNTTLSQVVEALGVLDCSNPTQLNKILNQMTAANYANLEWMTLISDTQISSALSNHVYSQECKNTKCGCKKGSFFAIGLGNFQDTNSFDWLSGYDSITGGGLIGFDVCSDHVHVGFGGGYTYTDFNIKDDAGFGDVKSGFGALYTSFVSNYFIANASVIAGGKHFDMNRKVAFLSINEVANSKFNSPFANAHLGLMIQANMHDFRLELFGNADYHYWYREKLAETGSAINLVITKHHSHFIKTELGTNLNAILHYQNKCFVPFVGVSVVKIVPLGKTNYNARFEFDDFCMFTLTSNSTQELVAPRCGLRIHTNSFSFTIDYKGEFNKTFRNHQVSGRLEWAF